MAQGLRKLLNALFPEGEGRNTKSTSELIERGLEALRSVRDERAIKVKKSKLVPSRLELRLPESRYDELTEVGAIRDIAFFFNEELMNDLAAEGMKTFGDHPVHVSVTVDTSLQPNEIAASVLAPEEEPQSMYTASAGSDAPYDRTSVLGLDDAAMMQGAGVAAGQQRLYRLVIREGGRVLREIPLDGKRWIIGRHGSSGASLPEGYRKVDVDLRPTVSREQVRLDLIDEERLRIQRIGKGATSIISGDQLKAEENRLIAVGMPFYIEEYEMVVMRVGS